MVVLNRYLTNQAIILEHPDLSIISSSESGFLWKTFVQRYCIREIICHSLKINPQIGVIVQLGLLTSLNTSCVYNGVWLSFSALVVLYKSKIFREKHAQPKKDKIQEKPIFTKKYAVSLLCPTLSPSFVLSFKKVIFSTYSIF